MTDYKVGDRVFVTHPDPDYGCACIAAAFKAAYLVTEVSLDGKRLLIETRLPGMVDDMPIDSDEVTKTDQLPWWIK
jgi:hypothetical protein